ncbi:MAG TPA: TylF/MycF/NovP-related O-methyltransferase [Stellaceae bacterium]|nr:TylF/MycF/NovP-related O-methyltransferase [Stellaceae bacterium]
MSAATTAPAKEPPTARSLRGLAALPRFLLYHRIHRRFRDFTMVGRAAYIANLYLADRALADPALAGGAVIECGTWKGGMAAGLARLGGPGRDYWFFDSFAGLPPVGEKDGEAARRWQADAAGPSYLDNCRASREAFARVIGRVALPPERVHICAGFFVDTFPAVAVPPVAVLRLDADWYESTLLCLEKFWPNLLPGALVLIDDYYAWEGCRKAVHAFLARREAAEAIRQSRFGKVAYMVKS